MHQASLPANRGTCDLETVVPALPAWRVLMITKQVAILICLPLLVTGCGGGAGSTPATGTPTKSLSAQPQSLAFTNQAGQQSTVTLIGGTPPYAVKVADLRFVSVSAPVTSSGTTTFTVAPIAGGSTTIAASDSNGASTTVSVSTQVCTPPAPTPILSYPASGATGISSSLSQIWVADRSGDPMISYLTAFGIRLVGSDGSTVQGLDLLVTNSSPPPGGAPPPTGSTYIYGTSSVSGAKSGLTYQVQLTNTVYPCMPPETLGSFST